MFNTVLSNCNGYTVAAGLLAVGAVTEITGKFLHSRAVKALGQTIENSALYSAVSTIGMWIYNSGMTPIYKAVSETATIFLGAVPGSIVVLWPVVNHLEKSDLDNLNRNDNLTDNINTVLKVATLGFLAYGARFGQIPYQAVLGLGVLAAASIYDPLTNEYKLIKEV